MDNIIYLLKNNARTDKALDFDNSSYLYHGIYIPYFNDSSSIISILDNGLLTLRDQYNIGIISLDDIKQLGNYKPDRKSILNIFKYRNIKDEDILSNDRNNILFFSPNRNFFNRVFDISFVVKKDSSFIYRNTNLLTEKQAMKMMGKGDYTEYTKLEYIKFGSVLPTEFVAIRINLDELLNPESVQERGVSIEEIVPRLIKMVNDIYDELEENNLNIPIINSNDNRVLNKTVFRNLMEMFSQRKIK